MPELGAVALAVASGSGNPRICVIGAGPCGLAALKNLLQADCGDVVCYDESGSIGGNWAYSDDPQRISVYECTHIISSKRMSSFDDFPMPVNYPDYPSHKQLLAYFSSYAKAFNLEPHIRLQSRVERCDRRPDGRWSVRVVSEGVAREETYDWLVVCSGHHRKPFIPDYPGKFGGTITHSASYKRPDPFRGQRVLIVGAGNSAADIAVDISRVAASAAISMREGTYFIPKLMFGQPVDTVYAFWKGLIPKPIFQSIFKLTLRMAIGRFEDYGLETPPGAPLSKHPTLNSTLLEALRHGRLTAKRGIARFEGKTVHFTDGSREDFDTIVMATGFRTAFPFLQEPIEGWDLTKTPPLYLKMMHKTIDNLFFLGLFQPIGCIWQLADYQARIAALQIKGRLKRPTDIGTRIEREVASPHWRFDPSPRHAIEVDYHDFRKELMRELRPAA